MATEISTVFAELEGKYNIWLSSSEQMQEMTYQINDVPLTVIFNKGCWVPPSFSFEVQRKLDSINVASGNPEIQKIFEASLEKVMSGAYMFPSQLGAFKLKFFESEDKLRSKIARENNYNARRKNGSLVGFSGCSIL